MYQIMKTDIHYTVGQIVVLWLYSKKKVLPVCIGPDHTASGIISDQIAAIDQLEVVACMSFNTACISFNTVSLLPSPLPPLPSPPLSPYPPSLHAFHAIHCIHA